MITDYNPQTPRDELSDNLWTTKLTYNLKTGQDGEFTRDIRFNLDKSGQKSTISDFLPLVGEGGSKEIELDEYPSGNEAEEFQNITRQLYDATGDNGAIDIQIRIFVVGYDMRGQAYLKRIEDQTISIDGICKLRRDPLGTPKLSIIRLKPEFEIDKYGPTPTAIQFEEDSLGIKISNESGIAGIVLCVEYKIRFYTEGGWKDSNEFYSEFNPDIEFKGTKQEIEEKLIEGEEVIFPKVGFELNGGEVTVGELTDAIVSSGFQYPFAVDFTVLYRDEVNNRYETRQFSLGSFSLDKSELAADLSEYTTFTHSSKLNNLKVKEETNNY